MRAWISTGRWPCSAACRPPTSCAATGRRSRCWCAPRCPGALRRRRPARAVRARRARRRRVAPGRSRAAARWSVRPGRSPRRALPPLATPGVDAAGAGRRPARASGASAAAALSLRRRRAPRRRHGARTRATAAASARTSIRTTSSCCRRRAAALARSAASRRPRLRDDVPLKMLADFAPSEEWLLEPGDMLYLPPGWGHDGVAVGECITARSAFARRARASSPPTSLQRLAEAARDDAGRSRRRAALSRRRRSRRADRPARIPGVAAALRRRRRSSACSPIASRPSRALGEVLSEPKPGTWFERARSAAAPAPAIALDRAHPHALRRALRLRQRRGVPCRRTRCDTDAPARRPAPARREARGRRERRGPRAARRMAERRLVRRRSRTERRGHDMTADDIAPIASRAEFLDAVRAAFARPRQPARARSSSSIPNFADWPLNERAVIESLSRWIDSQPAPGRDRAQLRRAGAASAALRRVAQAVGARRAMQERSRARGRADPDAAARSGATLRPPARPRPLPRHGVESTGRSDRVPGNR